MSKFGPTDPYAYYDNMGNRHIFLTHKEFLYHIRAEEMKKILTNRQ